jgi:hypothetical protein
MASNDRTNEQSPQEGPTPGSPEAIESGCSCSAKQNNRGKNPPFPIGSHIGGATGGWLIAKACTLHVTSAYRGALVIS